MWEKPEKDIIVINMVSTKIDACLEHYERAIDFVWGLLKSHLNSAIEGSIVITGENKDLEMY